MATALVKNGKPAKRPRQEDSDQDAVSRHSSIMNGFKNAEQPTGSESRDKSYFSLTSYLFDEDSKHEQKDHVVAVSEPTSLYGQVIPDEPGSNVCAGCLGRRDAELSDDPILLCDGAHCGREYHLACCIPPLTSVPEVEEWLCQDCSPDGSTASLIQYLESSDQAKQHYLSTVASGKKSHHSYVEHLLRLDMAALGARRGDQLLPESELEKSAMIHSLALCDANHSLARTRGGNERRASLPPSELIGKPVRLFLIKLNEPKYHTGRIVDYREVSNVETRSSSTFSPHKGTSPVASPSTNTEFLVRFPAGIDYRKTSHHHWIVLEEHAVSLASTMVWARISTGHWKPASLWLRTGRALISTMKSLPTSIDAEISKTKHKVCALARAFGDDVFTEVNVRDQCVDLLDRNAVDAHRRPDNTLPFSLAKTELAEQERVRNWRELKQMDPMGPAVLSSRDYVSLPVLEAYSETSSLVMKSKNGSSTIAPIPNIRLGLDRSKLLSMLHQRGYNPTKDMAASLSCEILPIFDARTIEAVCCDIKSTRH
jgi:PHD-finger